MNAWGRAEMEAWDAIRQKVIKGLRGRDITLVPAGAKRRTCVVCGKEYADTAGRAICDACARQEAESGTSERLCIKCGVRHARPGKATCAECGDALAARKVRRYVKHEEIF